MGWVAWFVSQLSSEKRKKRKRARGGSDSDSGQETRDAFEIAHAEALGTVEIAGPKCSTRTRLPWENSR